MTLYMIATVSVFSAGVKGEHDVFPAMYAMVVGSLVLVGMLAVAHSNYAFGLHKNNTGSSIGFGTVAAMGLWMGESAKRRRRLITAVLVILLAGLLYTLSRGSWMGVIAGSLVMVALRGQWRLALRIVLIGAPVIAIGWMLLPAESKEYATSVGADAYNTKTRLQSIEYALSFFQRSPVLGVGPGLRKNFDATNVMMTTLSETGVLGFVTFFSIFLVLGVTAWRAARRLKPNDPALVLLTVGAALMVDQLVHGMVDHYWVRGILPVWAGAGLVVYVSNQLRANKQPREQRI
jgi:O-antigen ligase